METKNISKSFYSEGVLLALIPALGYWLAYMFELGFIKLARIPTEFIDVGLSQILTSMAAILFVIPSIWYLIKRLVLISILLLGKRGYIFSVSIILSSIILLLAYVYSGLFWQPLLFSIFITIFLLINFYSTDPNYWTKGEYPERKKYFREFYKETFFSMFIVENKVSLNLVFANFLFLSIFVAVAGAFTNVTETWYLVNKGAASELIVLKRYKDYYLLVSLDRTNKQYSNDFRLTSIDSPDLVLHYERIGPLRSELLPERVQY